MPNFPEQSAYKTGRQRTITASGHLYANHYANWPNSFTGYYGSGRASFSALGTSASIELTGGPTIYNTYEFKASLSVSSSGAIPSESVDVPLASGPLSGYPFSYAVDFGVEIEVSIDTEEWMEVVYRSQQYPYPAYKNLYPPQGTGSVVDGLPTFFCQFIERVRTATITATWDGGSVSSTWTPEEGEELFTGITHACGVNLRTSSSAAGTTKAEGGCTIMGISRTFEDAVRTESSSFQTSTADLTSSEDARLALTLPNNIPGTPFPSSVTKEASFSFGPDVSYELKDSKVTYGDTSQSKASALQISIGGVEYGWNTPVRTLVSPGQSTLLTQKKASLNIFGKQILSIDTKYPIQAYLTKESLRVTGDDTDDWRLQFRGIKWNALSLSRVNSITLDDCTALTNWTAGPNTTATLAAGALRFTASGGTGSATLTIPSASRNWELFRYLRVSGKANFPGNFQLLINSLQWNFTLDGALKNLDFDLCCTSNEMGLYGTVQSRFPIASGTNPTNSRSALQYSLGWGVNYCDTLKIVIPDNFAVDLTDVQLLLKGTSTVKFNTPFRKFVSLSNSSSSQVQPLLNIYSDDRPTDWLGMVTTGNLSIPYNYYSIQEVASMLGTLSGITATALPDLSDGYHKSTLEGFRLGGQGFTYDWDTETWEEWSSRELSTSTLTVPAQDLFDTVLGYPGIGNPWDGSDYGPNPVEGALPLVFAKRLRGKGVGILYDEFGQPKDKVQVSSFTTGGIFTGSATSSATGAYVTGQPYGYCGSTIETSILAPGFERMVVATWHSRGDTRISMRLAPIPCAGADPRLPSSCDVSTFEGGLATGSCRPIVVSGTCDCNQSLVTFLPPTYPGV